MSGPLNDPPTTARNPFEEVLSRFKKDLKAKEKEYFKFATEEEFKKEVEALQTRLHNGRRQQNMTKLRGFIEAMVQFGKVIDLFCQTSEVVPFIWGPWKLLLLIGDTFSNAFAELLDTYEQLGDTMNLLLQTKSLFPNDSHMALVISGIYKDVLEFHRKAFKYFQQPMLKQLFQATWKTYKTSFSDLIQAMENHRILLIGQMTLSEARRTREAEEARLMDLKMDRETRIRRELYGWLHSANVKNDHHRFKMIRAAHPNSCRWLLSKREFRRWFDRFPSTIPALLWPNGIPGAGKTILSSMIIDEAQSLAEKPTVLFFYCRTDDPEKNTFISLARSLLRQLLEREEGLLPFFYEKYKASTEATLATISDAEDLLEVAIKNTPSVYIVLDGIDECGREQRKAIVRWFRKLVEELPQKSSDQVRCLFVSQDDGPARKDFAGMIAMKIQAEDNRDDIREFSTSWASQIQQKFELPVNETDQIATQITDTCHGMFLLARLICENLLEQSTYEDLRHELEPDVFPQEINDAYERIMCRISSQITSKRKENYCLLILGWLVCSKRPLRWQEIQVMKSLDAEANNINMKQRCLCDQPKDICGSMVDEFDDGVVDLVHQTAKLFLVDNNHVNPAIEELKLATLCIDYMSLPLNRLSLPDISTSILAGHFVFLEYAALFWVRHLESGVSSSKIDEIILQRLTKSLSRFLDIHWTNMTSPLIVSERSKGKLQIFNGSTFFERLLQAVVSTRKHLSLFAALDLLMMLHAVRSHVEGQISMESDRTRDLLLNMYGQKPFKCLRPSCHHFCVGFPSADLRNIHVEKHLRPYTCLLEGCPSSAIGLSTQAELHKHMRIAHGLTSEGVEPDQFPDDEDIELGGTMVTTLSAAKKRKGNANNSGTRADYEKSRKIALSRGLRDV